jgi:alkylation response protein AidB-like acyl-CoA dehydrogenase
VDFSESPKVAAIRGIVREFVEKEIIPLEPALLRHGFKALLPELRTKRERAKQTGLWAAHVPEEYGGAGLSLSEFAHMSEELGRSPIGHYAGDAVLRRRVQLDLPAGR